MCHQSSHPPINPEEPVAAEECLLIYCKHVELYNILQRRAQHNPSFLPRCLNYKIEAKREIGLRDQNVIFTYRDQNNLLRKTEVTRHFSCPFCLMRCGSFKGLRCHLSTSHDLFKYEFWTSEEYIAVNVSVRADTLCSETIADESEAYLQSFSHCSKPQMRKRPENPLDRGENVYPHVFVSALPMLTGETLLGGLSKSVEGETCCSYENGVSNDIACVAANGNQGIPVARAQSIEDMDRSVPTTFLPNAKSRKHSIEHTRSGSSINLQKRKFYHPHRAQPMAVEQVLSDRDSENEVDDHIVDLEDRRMLDDFVAVSRNEKQLMELWNSFVTKQRVADGHTPWACEAFLQLHGKLLAESSPLSWCWRLFMTKLCNDGLIDAGTINNCNMILQKYQDEVSEVEKCSNTGNPEP